MKSVEGVDEMKDGEEEIRSSLVKEEAEDIAQILVGSQTVEEFKIKFHQTFK